LDVGVGRGNTSIYLASRGHSVSVVEPSPEFCRLLGLATNLYSLSLKIYNCNAESIQKINGLFDVIIFNSSLHHCDDPIKALKSCYSCLSERGKLLLINEPILQFYRSEKWFYTRLETHPHEMGHYGGNEHNYRYHEYLEMLKKAGFLKVTSEPHISLTDYQGRVKQAEVIMCKERPLYDPRDIQIKKIYYYVVYKLITLDLLDKIFPKLLTYLSLVPSTFIATK
jgi:2-polyprenyl-3-methyl-5-hydroxy-6-metoxy-1,4-benzoquinol methylase